MKRLLLNDLFGRRDTCRPGLSVRRTLTAAAALAVLALTFAISSFAQPATTNPGASVVTTVLIKESGIYVGESARLPRGVDVTFIVKNLCSTPQNFRFLGKVTKPIKPGHAAALKVLLTRRGVFPYLSTLGGKQLRGLFIVY